MRNWIRETLLLSLNNCRIAVTIQMKDPLAFFLFSLEKPMPSSSEISPDQQFKIAFLDVLGGKMTSGRGLDEAEQQLLSSRAKEIDQRTSQLEASLQSLSSDSLDIDSEVTKLSEMASALDDPEAVQALQEARIQLAEKVAVGEDPFSGDRLPPELVQTLSAAAGCSLPPMYEQYKKSAEVIEAAAAAISKADPSAEDYEEQLSEQRRLAEPHIQNVRAYEKGIEQYAKQYLS
ncbi:MAG: hypothetical protein VX278_17700 [Myxococcota bacterium]|nr:hypothetical protein [Myxococcota bacterium]